LLDGTPYEVGFDHDMTLTEFYAELSAGLADTELEHFAVPLHERVTGSSSHQCFRATSCALNA